MLIHNPIVAKNNAAAQTLWNQCIITIIMISSRCEIKVCHKNTVGVEIPTDCKQEKHISVMHLSASTLTCLFNPRCVCGQVWYQKKKSLLLLCIF